MSGEFTCDVLVVGAGPAGSLAAARLARAGLRILILEKEKWPRYKACGGALVPRAWQALPFALDGRPAVVEHRIRSARLSLNLHNPLAVERAEPVLAMTMRAVLDDYLLEEARRAGAELRDNAAVKSVVEFRHSVRCDTANGTFTAPYLIGADGVYSVVARAIPPFDLPRAGLALEGEVLLKKDSLLEEYAGRTDFDFLVLPRGYGWVFPKADHLSVGVYTLLTAAPDIRRHFKGYLERKGLSPHVAEVRVRGHAIPLGPHTEKLNSARVLLVGDAAGLADPLSGEGLSYAIRSGQLAAEALLGTLASPSVSLNVYSETIRRTLLPEIRRGARIAHVLYTAPTLGYRLLARKPMFAQRVADVFEGCASYGELLRKLVLKPYRLF